MKFQGESGWRGYWVLVFGALAALGAALLMRYVGLERTYYFWDHALYPGYAEALFRLWREHGAAAALAALHNSFNDDFSRLFTLPSLAGFALTGGVTRPVYVAANFLAYGAGLALALGGLLRLLRGGAYGIYACAALPAVMACGFAQTSLTDGYPDLGGAVFLALALLLLLRDWPRVKPWRWLAVGMLLALAILFRRHFIYPASVLLAVVGVGQLRALWPRRRDGRAWRAAVLVALAPLTAAASLWLLAPAFVERLIGFDYPELYHSYAEPAAALLDKDLNRVGALGLFLALAGYALTWRRQPAQRERLAVFLGLLLGWGVLWFGWVRFGGQHYLSQIMPIILPIGWVLLVMELCAMGRTALAVLAVFWLALQAVAGFWLADLFLPKRNDVPVLRRQWFTGLMAEIRPPRQRQDYDALRQLAGDLLAGIRPDDRVAVLASSPIFNQDILGAAAQAWRQEHGGQGGLPILTMPDVDRRDALPLDGIGQATILLLVTPPQYHLPPEGQLVVGSAIALLTQDADFAAAWRRDGKTYALEQGATLSVWRLRQPWTPAARAAMLDRLRRLSEPSGSLPQDWVTERADFTLRGMTDARNRSRIMGMLAPAAPPARLFFMPALAPAAYRVSGVLAAECAVRMQLRALAGDGTELATVDLPLAADGNADGNFAAPFAVRAPQAFYLHLELQARDTAHPCGFEIRDLTVETAR